MKRSFESQRNLLTRMFTESESVTCTSYKIMHTIAKRGKLFTDGNFIKECILEAENNLCLEKTTVWNYPHFSKFNCAENLERA